MVHHLLTSYGQHWKSLGTPTCHDCLLALFLLNIVVNTTRPAVLLGNHVLCLFIAWPSTLLSGHEHAIVTLEVSTSFCCTQVLLFILFLTPFAVVYIVIIFCMGFTRCLSVMLDPAIPATSGSTMIWTSSKKWSSQLFGLHSNYTRCVSIIQYIYTYGKYSI